MTHDEALVALADLLTRARAAVEAGDAAAVEQVALATIWLDVEPATPTSRELAVAFSRVAEALAELVRPEAGVGLFQRVGHAYQNAPDATFSDTITMLNNLAFAQSRAGDAAASETLTVLAQLAGAWTGEVDAACARVFMHHAELCRKSKQYPAMVVLQEQAMRFMLHAALADDVRAAWFSDHLQALREAGQHDRLMTEIGRIEAACAVREDMPLTLGLCMLERSFLSAASGDFAESGRLVDRALDQARGLPEREVTQMLTHAARFWFKAGDFDRSAARARRALRRRVGLVG